MNKLANMSALFTLTLATGCFSIAIPDSFHDLKNNIERTPDSVNIGLLVASDITLACDMGETEWVDWGDKYVDRHENNPILGAHPDALKIGLYFAAVIGVNTAVYPLLPKWARTLWYSTVSTDEAYTDAYHNMQGFRTTKLCGLGPAYPTTTMPTETITTTPITTPPYEGSHSLLR